MQDGTANVVLVGSGSVAVGREVADSLGVAALDNVALLVDPWWRLYEALGVKRGFFRTFTFRRPENAAGLRAWPKDILRGRFVYLNAGHPYLQGCTLVLSRDGGARFAHFEQTPGFPRLDHAALARAVRDPTCVARKPIKYDGELDDEVVVKWVLFFLAGALLGALGVTAYVWFQASQAALPGDQTQAKMEGGSCAV